MTPIFRRRGRASRWRRRGTCRRLYAEELLAPWLAVLRDMLPPLDVVDMHVHVGLADPAGLLATEEEALSSLALAGERRLPIMIHAGRGVPEMADQVHRRSHDHLGARLILAHCGAGVFDGIWPRIDGYPNVLFDTSWWNPATIAALLRLVPPSHILFASDLPFATPTQQAVQTLRLALQVGLTHRQIQGIMGGQARCVLAHRDLLELGATPPSERSMAPALERMYVMLVAVCERMLGGQDGGQELEMALDGCAVGADGPDGEVLRAMRGLLGQIEKRVDRDPLRQERTPGFDLALVAATVARTPDAPIPELDR